MRKKRFSESGSLAIRNHRRLAPLSEGSLLSPFRQLTHTRQTRVFKPSTPISGISEKLRRAIMPRARLSVLNFDKLRICQGRKARRRVIFATKKAGGNHKKPIFKLSSLVRC